MRFGQGSREFRVLLLFLVAIVGFGFAGLLYRAEFGGFSYGWRTSSPWAPLVTSMIALTAALLTVAWLIAAKQWIRETVSRQALTVGSVLFVGFGFGMCVPLALGLDGAWTSKAVAPPEAGEEQIVPEEQIAPEVPGERLETAVYDLYLDSKMVKVPDELKPFQVNGSGPYVTYSNRSQQLILGLNQPGAREIRESGRFPRHELGQVTLAWAEIGKSNVTVTEWLNLTDLDPRIQNLRDLVVTQNGVAFSNIELKEDCFVIQVWSLQVPEVVENLRKAEVPELVWESSPCLQVAMSPEFRVAADQGGGRLAVDSMGQIILAVGDFRVGVVQDQALGGSDAQALTGRPAILGDSSPYGKILRIQEDGSAEIISSGHRNPQGLYFDQTSDKLWSSEHGPKGGDELNLIIEGADFGWPDVSYGIPYGPGKPTGEFSLSRWGRHEGFESPRFSWMPSVAASQVLVYKGEEFPGWQEDILMATLRDQAVYRLRLEDDRVVFAERIEIGERDTGSRRIRDMLELPDGRILLSFDSGELGLLSISSFPEVNGNG